MNMNRRHLLGSAAAGAALIGAGRTADARPLCSMLPATRV